MAKKQVRLTIASNAGGSGKTTMAVHLAYLIGVRGYKVALLELDHNGSLATFASFSPELGSIADVLAKDFDGSYPLAQLWSGKTDSIFAIPGGRELEEAITLLYTYPRKPYTMADRLKKFPLEADLIIFDTPATLEPMGVLALAASTHVLAPIKPEFKDAHALGGLLDWHYRTIGDLMLDPEPKFLGFVPTRVDLGIATHRNLLGLNDKGKENPKIQAEETLPYIIENQFEIRCFPPIKESNYYLQASGAGLPIHIFRPGLPCSSDFNPIVEELILLLEGEE